MFATCTCWAALTLLRPCGTAPLGSGAPSWLINCWGNLGPLEAPAKPASTFSSGGFATREAARPRGDASSPNKRQCCRELTVVCPVFQFAQGCEETHQRPEEPAGQVRSHRGKVLWGSPRVGEKVRGALPAPLWQSTSTLHFACFFFVQFHFTWHSSRCRRTAET